MEWRTCGSTGALRSDRPSVDVRGNEFGSVGRFGNVKTFENVQRQLVRGWSHELQAFAPRILAHRPTTTDSGPILYEKMSILHLGDQ
eukprot:1319991-Amorphochlora_amoeboformis.AAC.1